MTQTHFATTQAFENLARAVRCCHAQYETYQRLYRNLDLTADALTLLESLPALSRVEYRNLSTDVRISRDVSGLLFDVSSGSTGVRSVRASSRGDERSEAAIAATFFDRLGLGAGHRLLGLDVDSADIYNFYGSTALELGIDAYVFEAVRSDFSPTVHCWLAPTTLITVPSLLSRLLFSGGFRGLTSLELVILIGEPTTKQLRQLVTTELGAECFSFYGCTEAGSIASECREHDGLHVLSDDLILSVRTDGCEFPGSPGELHGDLLWTTLNYECQPVIKYDCGDTATIVDAPCPCGQPGARLRGIRRREEAFSLLGQSFDYSRFRDSILARTGWEPPLRIEFSAGLTPALRFVLPNEARPTRSAISEALMQTDDLAYFVERGFLSVEIGFEDFTATKRRKAGRVLHPAAQA